MRWKNNFLKDEYIIPCSMREYHVKIKNKDNDLVLNLTFRSIYNKQSELEKTLKKETVSERQKLFKVFY